MASLEGEIGRTIRDFPDKKAVLENDLSQVKANQMRVAKYQEDVAREYHRIDRGKADYAVLIDSTRWIGVFLKKMVSQDSEVRFKASRLYHDYSQTLVDRRILETGSGSRFEFKYLIIEDGEPRTEWMDVGEEMFNRHEAHLGMDLLFKPYGFFDHEAIHTPMPHGIVLAGNPRYGEWLPHRDGVAWYWKQKYRAYGHLYAEANTSYHYSRTLVAAWSQHSHASGIFFGPDGGAAALYGTAGSVTCAAQAFSRDPSCN